MNAPGSHRPLKDSWGRFSSRARALPEGALWVVDEKVARLHPTLESVIASRRPLQVVKLRAGESLKSARRLEQVAPLAAMLPRSGAVIAVGGGTVGDFATVLAHLVKRGVQLFQVPTTLLAAVDSSVGGKGALNVSGVKNALGVFHYADAGLICEELFETLTAAQKREGAVEAYKMAVCLDAKRWAKWSVSAPSEAELVRTSRELKASLCAEDPYEQSGRRAVLNFGHTFGHVVESLTHYRVRHGEAVGIGVHCALDVGVAMKVTPPALAAEVEQTFAAVAPRARVRLKRVLAEATEAQISALLKADKKGTASSLKMVLLEKPGKTRLTEVSPSVWMRCLKEWR